MRRLASYAAEALEEIWRNRMRSLLTIVGMIVGTASIIAVIGTSRAAQAGIAATLGGLTDAGIFVAVDPQGDDPNASRMQFRDARAIVERNPELIKQVYPFYDRSFRLDANGVSYDTIAVSGSGDEAQRQPLSAGRWIDDGDVLAGAHLCLISQDLADRFFHSHDVIGREIRVRGSRFRIIGVYARGANALSSTLAGSEYVVIPYTTFAQLAPGPVDLLKYYPRPGVASQDASSAVLHTLKRLHGTHAQYQVLDNRSLIESFDRTVGVIANGLAAVGAISLLVAGIGIMNVMLVAVTERTHEIGLRKSIGASSRDITQQFLLEALFLSAMGGFIGSVLGLVVTVASYAAIQRYIGPASVPYATIAVLAIAFSGSIGLIFGTYPALRAGKLDPAAALRA
ncbi:MAG: ABC transporter permease [Vulcanimicrobiaceae bacterium]